MFTAIRYLFWYATMVVVLACTSTSYVSTDKSLQTYYNSFISLIQNTCPTLTYNKPGYRKIQFGHLESPVIGLCETRFNWYTVTIDKDFWESASESDKYQLAMHEFTHCVLLLDHVDDKDHYMYSELANLKKREVTNQVIEVIKEQCKK